MSFHAFKNADGNDYGSFEVWYAEADVFTQDQQLAPDYVPSPAGWYWWPCYPDSTPDGDHHGPFTSEQEAIDDAQGGASYLLRERGVLPKPIRREP